ncbi:hypothetical protein C5B42_04710 [Candidatus Cerribacteria bacterium 'Amazon FNV 2010 28 9']|uniref:Uncharacterized protein n=1 Tax=Candidatus Cerribacteria bacterium 'Amazon FNV 2010 28 9' TaxID=2081795 RepID=A0A317JS03_9BACT|nr:MAG: hypothetical protein C5B42_04710 [Candidatus Cerribacteria bacterium 'Amazon FNV 2010 28 9']
MKKVSFTYVHMSLFWFAGITFVCFLVFGVAQQMLRQSASEPQLQMAQDTALLLANGSSLDALRSIQPVELTQSLSPYVFVYDEQGNQLLSSAQLNGKVPSLPTGLFSYVKTHTDDRVTWQPQQGVREALVGVYFHGAQSGYVFVGRSLREVERQIDHVGEIVLAAWVVGNGGGVALLLFFISLSSKRTH